MLEQIKDNFCIQSACLSLWIIWLETGAGFIPNNSHTFSSIEGGILAWLPTGPDICPTLTTVISWLILFSCLFNSSHQRANFKPKLIGSAWIPWDLPMHGVFLNSRALFLMESFSFLTSSSIIFKLFTSCKLNAVSFTSLEVRPWWIHLFSSPKLSPTALVNETKSCLVSENQLS